MNLAVIGTGYWGTNHVRVGAELLEEGRVSSLTLCDTDESRVATLADDYGVDYVTSHERLLERSVDAAVVATPSTTHHPIARDLMEAGTDLLVEKPLAMDAEAAWDLVDCADRYDRTLAVGHIFRCHPALEELKRRIDRGELGTVKYLTSTRFSFRAPRSTSGVLYQLAVHDVDVSNYLLEERPERGYCQLDSVVREGVPETASITLDYGDATSVIDESWQVPVHGKRRDLTVVGSEKAAHVDYLADTTLEMYDSRVVEQDGALTAHDEGVTTYELDDAEPLRLEVERFLDASETGGEPPATGAVGAETVELLERLSESAAEQRVVDLA